MKLQCVENRPTSLPPSQQNGAARFESTYDLTVGREYPVVAMMLSRSVLYFFVGDDQRTPLMAPSGMFAQSWSSLPDAWEFDIKREPIVSESRTIDEGTVALWGYSEFVHDTAHYQELTEWAPQALAVFNNQVRRA